MADSSRSPFLRTRSSKLNTSPPLPSSHMSQSEATLLPPKTTHYPPIHDDSQELEVGLQSGNPASLRQFSAPKAQKNQAKLFDQISRICCEFSSKDSPIQQEEESLKIILPRKTRLWGLGSDEKHSQKVDGLMLFFQTKLASSHCRHDDVPKADPLEMKLGSSYRQSNAEGRQKDEYPARQGFAKLHRNSRESLLKFPPLSQTHLTPFKTLFLEQLVSTPLMRSQRLICRLVYISLHVPRSE